MEYDFKKVRQLYKTLKVPKYNLDTVTEDYAGDLIFKTCERPFEHFAYNCYISPRGVGKTTDVILTGMCMNKLYGTTISYVRTYTSMTTEGKTSTLFNIINDFLDDEGKNYVEKLYDGDYNRVVLNNRQKKFYLAFVDEDGNEVRRSHAPLCHILSVEDADTYKSTLNDINNNWFVYDECVEKYYASWIYENLMQLISTVKRKRLDFWIFLIGNSLDRQYHLFDEFDIREIMDVIQLGEKYQIQTDIGTKVYVEAVTQFAKERKLTEDIIKFFGFKSKSLESITGLDWTYKEYPHAPKQDEDFNKIDSSIYFLYFNKLLRCEPVIYKGALYFYIHKAKKLPDHDFICYHNKPVVEAGYRYQFGVGDDLDKVIYKYCKNGKVFFGTNHDGAVFDKYINEATINKLF